MRLLTILLAAGVVAAAGLTAFTIPASAQSETVTVRLPNGQIVHVTVDVPPGGSIKDVKLPGTLVDATETAQAETPAPPQPQGTTTEQTTPAPPPAAGTAERRRRLAPGSDQQRRARQPGAREGSQDHCQQASSEG